MLESLSTMAVVWTKYILLLLTSFPFWVVIIIIIIIFDTLSQSWGAKPSLILMKDASWPVTMGLGVTYQLIHSDSLNPLLA